MKLSDVKAKNAKPREKAYYLFDGGGLYLHVAPSGGKWWRLKYRFDGRERRMSLGVYPDVSLKKARDRKDDAREKLADGIDPAQAKKAEKRSGGVDTFEQVAREWHETFQSEWVESHASRILRRLERDVFPYVGNTAFENVEAPELLEVLRRIEARGARETAHRIHSSLSQIFRYGIATARIRRNPAEDLRGALAPAEKRHLSAITEPEELATLLADLAEYEGFAPTKIALKLAPYVFVRPVELRTAEWTEFDLDKAEWTIPARKMKARRAHLIPLPHQAVALLRDLEPLSGEGKYLFPSTRSKDRPMSNNTVNAALRRLGYPKEVMTGHGFRATARTLLDEELGVRPEYIEHQLAHTVKDPLGRAYNRTKHLKERRAMMQKWADYLDELADG